jgi:hypothetical protein
MSFHHVDAEGSRRFLNGSSNAFAIARLGTRSGRLPRTDIAAAID